MSNKLLKVLLKTSKIRVTSYRKVMRMYPNMEILILPLQMIKVCRITL